MDAEGCRFDLSIALSAPGTSTITLSTSLQVGYRANGRVAEQSDRVAAITGSSEDKRDERQPAQLGLEAALAPFGRGTNTPTESEF
jgi:hypothetical protein